MAFGSTNKNGPGGGGTEYWLLQNADGELFFDDGWDPSLQSDVALNDSDKTFTVPANTKWRVKWIYVELTSTATAGTRQMEVQIQDDTTDVIARLACGDTQIESLTFYYLFAPHVAELTAERDVDKLTTLMPEWILPAGYIVRVWDNDARDPAADDMIVHMMVEARSTP